MRNLRVGVFALSAWWALGLGCSANSGGPELKGRTITGRVVAANGRPVPGVKILLGKSTIESDEKGLYALETDSKGGVVRFEKSGYLPGLERVQVEKNFSVGLDVVLLPQGPRLSVDVDEGGEALGPRGSLVRIPKNSLVDPDGERVKGIVDVYLTPIDPKLSAELRAAPGDFVTEEDERPRQLESFGMLDVTIMKNDAKLNVAKGETLEIKIPLPTGTEDPEEEMPLYSFDEERGIWVLEGSAQLSEDGDGYVGEVPHLSAWNIDRPYEATCVGGRVVDKDGNPVAGARVRGVGISYAGDSQAQTNERGEFALAVRQGSEVQVIAEHPLGGGRSRTIESGDAETEVPPNVGDEGCVDEGEWVVEGGTYVDRDGGTTFCSELAGQDIFDGCMLEFIERIGECGARFSGECTIRVDEDGGSVIEYEDGSRMESTTEGTSLYGAGGRLCYHIVVPENEEDLISYVFEDGTEYGISSGSEGEEFVLVCPSGESYTMTSDESAALQACNASEPDPGGDGTGGSGAGACKIELPDDATGGEDEEPDQGTGGRSSSDGGSGGSSSDAGSGGSSSPEGSGGSAPVEETPEGTTCKTDPDCTGRDQVCCPLAEGYLFCYTQSNCDLILESNR